jgi:hypothetical protein
MLEALLRIQLFLAVVLAERIGPLTSLQRDFLLSARTTATLAELRLLNANTNENQAP